MRNTKQSEESKIELVDFVNGFRENELARHISSNAAWELSYKITKDARLQLADNTRTIPMQLVWRFMSDLMIVYKA